MKSFTIKEIEKLSGVKAHNFRIWEQRYNLVTPQRRSGNSRLYTLDQFKLLLNITLLKTHGYKVSKLATLLPLEIQAKVDLLSNSSGIWQKTVNELVIMMYSREANCFEDVIAKFMERWPLDVFVDNVLYPFLKITRLLWSGHKLCEEHIVVTASRRKIILGIENQLLKTEHCPSVMLFLPDNRQLDLGLLYLHFFLKARGFTVVYLGTDVTLKNIISAFEITKPSFVYTYLQPNHRFPIIPLLDFMAVNAPLAKLIIGEYELPLIAPRSFVNLVQVSFEDSLTYLEDQMNNRSRADLVAYN